MTVASSRTYQVVHKRVLVYTGHLGGIRISHQVEGRVVNVIFISDRDFIINSSVNLRQPKNGIVAYRLPVGQRYFSIIAPETQVFRVYVWVTGANGSMYNIQVEA